MLFWTCKTKYWRWIFVDSFDGMLPEVLQQNILGYMRQSSSRPTGGSSCLQPYFCNLLNRELTFWRHFQSWVCSTSLRNLSLKVFIESLYKAVKHVPCFLIATKINDLCLKNCTWKSSSVAVCILYIMVTVSSLSICQAGDIRSKKYWLMQL